MALKGANLLKSADCAGRASMITASGSIGILSELRLGKDRDGVVAGLNPLVIED